MTEVIAQLVFPALVMVGLAGIAWLSSMGWRKAATVYPCRLPCSGTRWFFRSGVIANTKVGGMLVIGADVQGAYFSVVFPLSLFSPDLMVPWAEISGIERIGFLVRLELTFSRIPELRNEIPGPLADKLEAASGGIWQYERATVSAVN